MGYSAIKKNPFLAMDLIAKGQNQTIGNAIATTTDSSRFDPLAGDKGNSSYTKDYDNPLKYTSSIYGNNKNLAFYDEEGKLKKYNAGTVDVAGNDQYASKRSFGVGDISSLIAQSSETAGVERSTITDTLSGTRTFNPNSPDEDFKVDPKIFDGFDNLPKDIFGGEQGLEAYYGPNALNNNSQNYNGGSRNYNNTQHMTARELELYGNKQQALRDGYTDFADGYRSVKPPADSVLSQVTSNEKELSNLYNGIRSRIGGLFANDQYMDRALEYSMQKLGSEYQDLAKNEDAMALITGMNISEHGIKESGFGDVLKSYAEVADLIPKGLLTREWKNAYENGIKNSAGAENYKNGNVSTKDIIAGLESASSVQTKDYGYMQLNDNEVKQLTHEINTAMLNKVAEAAGFDMNAIKAEHEANGFKNKDSNYQMSGAYLLSAAAASQLTQEDSNGKTGFDKLVEQSQEAHGQRDTNGDAEGLYNASLNIMISNDPNADGSAFASTEEGLTGLAGLMPFTAGLSDNPLNPNTLNLAFQGNQEQAMEKINEFMEKAKDAGINFTNVNLKYKGHGGEDGHTLLDQDKQNLFGRKDAQQMGDIISKHVADGATVDVTADSCYGKRSSQSNAEAIAKAAGENDKSIKVTNSGSINYGLVGAHQIHSSDNGFERLTRNADGSVVSNRDRVDWSEGTNTTYSKGQQDFEAVAQQNAQINSDLYADFNERVNNEWTQSTSATAATETEFNFGGEQNNIQESQEQQEQVAQEEQERDREEETANV